MMKKYFITGLIVLLPLALTIAIVMFMVNLLTAPFVGIVRGILHYLDLLDTNFSFLSSEQMQIVFSKVIILVLLFFLTIGLGAFGRWFFVHYMLNLWDYILHRIPLVSSIYKVCQDVINTLFGSKTKSFKQVVLVPFPNPQTWSLGLLTAEHMPGLPQSESENVVAVFVPTTPNPTSGFMMMFNEKEIVYLDMKVEEAFKYIVSCGVIMPPFKPISSEQAHQQDRQLPE
jgi:uncharacterized membrane protein